MGAPTAQVALANVPNMFGRQPQKYRKTTLDNYIRDRCLHQCLNDRHKQIRQYKIKLWTSRNDQRWWHWANTTTEDPNWLALLLIRLADGKIRFDDISCSSHVISIKYALSESCNSVSPTLENESLESIAAIGRKFAPWTGLQNKNPVTKVGSLFWEAACLRYER